MNMQADLVYESAREQLMDELLGEPQAKQQQRQERLAAAVRLAGQLEFRTATLPDGQQRVFFEREPPDTALMNPSSPRPGERWAGDALRLPDHRERASAL